MNENNQVSYVCMRKDGYLQHYSVDPLTLPYCGHIICFNCLSKETKEFKKYFQCLECDVTVDSVFINLHSKTNKNKAIFELNEKIDGINNELKGFKLIII